MGFWDAVVLMFLIGAIAWLRSAKYRAGALPDRLLPDRLLSDRRRSSGRQIEPSNRESELESEITELRKRIAVLERIATEERKSREIAAEIESLRN